MIRADELVGVAGVLEVIELDDEGVTQALGGGAGGRSIVRVRHVEAEITRGTGGRRATRRM